MSVDRAESTFYFDNTDRDLPQHLHRTLAEMQNQCPVAWSPALGGFWALTKHEDIVQASRDWETFTVTGGIMIPPTGKSMPVIPAELDPPHHTSFRKLVLPHFTPKALQKWRTGLEAIVSDAFQPVLPLRSFDLVAQVARPVPVLAICLILGIDSDWERVSRLGEQFLTAVADVDHPERGKAAARELETFLQEEIDVRRGKPATDLLGQLVNADIDGEPMSPVEALGLVQLLVVAGHGTTVDAIGSMIYRLATEPGVRERASSDPAVVPLIVDETLRLHPPVWNMARTIVQNTELRENSMCPGEKVMLAYAAANRDPDKFGDPNAFDIDRPERSQHLTFGSGRHRCIGEALAKLELELVLQFVLTHMPNITLDGQAVWSGHTNSHGITQLPVRF